MKEWLSKLFENIVAIDPHLQDYHNGFLYDIIPDAKKYPLAVWYLDRNTIEYVRHGKIDYAQYKLVFQFIALQHTKSDGGQHNIPIVQIEDILHKIAERFWQTLRKVAISNPPYQLIVGLPSFEFMEGQRGEDLSVCQMVLTILTPFDDCDVICTMPCVPERIAVNPERILLNSELKC